MLYKTDNRKCANLKVVEHQKPKNADHNFKFVIFANIFVLESFFLILSENVMTRINVKE